MADLIMLPTYYVRHPDETYSVAEPQPTQEQIAAQHVYALCDGRHGGEQCGDPACHRVNLRSLEREIATEHCRVAIECHARQAPSSYPTPVYDTSEIESQHTDEEILASNRADLDRAVRYLDARDLLVRPVPECPQFVAFREPSHG